MSLYDVFAAVENSPLGAGIKQSTWLFPGIEAVHLLALAMLGGSVLLLDLRLMGVGLKAYPPSAIERGARPWMVAAIAVLIITGLLIGSSEALKLYGKPAYWVKMAALLAAILFTFTVRNPLARRDPPVGAATFAVATVSLLLWLTVALAGRWIGFS
jgi:hypothetical protein